MYRAIIGASWQWHHAEQHGTGHSQITESRILVGDAAMHPHLSLRGTTSVRMLMRDDG
jgi:hypothetical protein